MVTIVFILIGLGVAEQNKSRETDGDMKGRSSERLDKLKPVGSDKGFILSGCYFNKAS